MKTVMKPAAAADSLDCQFCDRSFRLDVFNPFCPLCGQPLLVTPGRTPRIRPGRGDVWNRFREFLPLPIDREATLGAGNTPLLPLSRLEECLGLPATLAKAEMQNPTGSFKDRGTVCAVSRALRSGLRAVGTVSTGNMAASTAAFGARAGLKTVVLVKEDTSPAKLASIAAYSPHLLRVTGDYGTLFSRSYEIGKKLGICFLNSLDPFRVEGYKTTSFEIFSQLGGIVPEFCAVPVSSGGHIIGLMRGFLDLKRAGLTDRMPFFIGVQAAGCSPIVRAFDSGAGHVRRFPRPRTVAQAISNPDPPGGSLVLKMIGEHGGTLIAVSDSEILEAQCSLAEKEGLFVLPSSAASLAGWAKLCRTRTRGKASSRCVLILTGTGLKGPSRDDVEPDPPVELSRVEHELSRRL